MIGGTVPGAAERGETGGGVTRTAQNVLEDLVRRADELRDEVRREAREGLGRRQREAVAWILDGVVEREVGKRLQAAEEMARVTEDARERAERAMEEARSIAEDARERAETAEREARQARKDGEELRRMGESLRRREIEIVEKVVRRATE